ncbi:hypothetical protein RND71_029838 [Anisodus tanguticus]|uniref:Uncharacterized protein n=1 Tax=Anisodus tanguticus TaxID=243964 RepID=A0AAE1RE65_9SOLA|nr:hypothetical protein RND71_029838 [Anisodus tanguticus]
MQKFVFSHIIINITHVAIAINKMELFTTYNNKKKKKTREKNEKAKNLILLDLSHRRKINLGRDK